LSVVIVSVLRKYTPPGGRIMKTRRLIDLFPGVRAIESRIPIDQHQARWIPDSLGFLLYQHQWKPNGKRRHRKRRNIVVQAGLVTVDDCDIELINNKQACAEYDQSTTKRVVQLALTEVDSVYSVE